MSPFYSVLPECFLLAMTLVILLTGLYLQAHRLIIVHLLAQLTLFGVFCVAAWELTRPEGTVFHSLFMRDHFTTVMEMLFSAGGVFLFANSRHYIRVCEHLGHPEYYVLGLFSILGMMILASSDDLLVLYLGLELLSLPLYAMVAMRRKHIKATEAGIKYFVTGAVASGLLLYGISLLFGATGSFDPTSIAYAIAIQPGNFLYILGLVFVLAGIAFKLGLVPFHAWMPDVYEGAPISVTLFAGTLPKLAAFGMLVRILLETLPRLSDEWQGLLICLALLSLFVGNVFALTQKNIKRLFAYSGIAHMGYMLLGLTALSTAGNTAAFFYIISYVIMSLAGFSLLTLLSSKGFECETLDQLRGLNSRNPGLAFLMLLVLFSMAGIPPLVGFFAKFLIFQALIQAHLLWLAVLGMMFAVIGVYYYLRVVKVMYFDAPENASPMLIDGGVLLVGINALALLVLGVFPSAMYSLALFGLS